MSITRIVADGNTQPKAMARSSVFAVRDPDAFLRAMTPYRQKVKVIPVGGLFELLNPTSGSWPYQNGERSEDGRTVVFESLVQSHLGKEGFVAFQTVAAGDPEDEGLVLLLDGQGLTHIYEYKNLKQRGDVLFDTFEHLRTAQEAALETA